jgi:hypothetical protein
METWIKVLDFWMDGHDKHTKPCGAWKLGLRFWTFGWIGVINTQPGGAWKLESFGIPL